MNLRIESITYQNIREFRDLSIDFTRDGGDELHHISLVQMPNGTGKTTTMQLIRQLIRGVNLEESEIMEYQPDFGASTGEFTIGFRSGSDRFRVHMQLDYDVGIVNYRHSYPQREGGGMNDGHFMPMEINDTLTENFVDLFIFNGELTDEFIETSENKAETALKIVNRLDRIESQQSLISQIVEKRQDKKGGAETEQGLKMAKTNLEKRNKKLTELNEKRDQLKDKIEEHVQEIEDLKEERKNIIAKEDDKLQDYTNLEQNIQNLQSDLKNESKSILEAMRRPSRLSKSLSDDFEELFGQMTILQLPKSTSEEFFTELAEGENCICDRPLNQKTREAIRSNAAQYLSDEDIGVLNTLKEQLRNRANPVDFESKLNELSDIRQDLKQNQMEQQALDLDDPDREKKKQSLTEQIEEEKTQKQNKERKLEYITTDDQTKRKKFSLDWENNIPSAKREVRKYQKKVEEATGTVQFRKQADALDRILDEFLSESLSNLKEKQIRKTNQRLSNILKRSKVQIESIDDSIKLRDRGGSSEGQSLAVAYAYLSTLFENSHVEIPFVVDSPAVSLDHKVRREVASTISNLFDQLIAFVISTEKEGFVDNLDAKEINGSDDIKYYTIYKTDEPGVVNSVTDEEFFMQFKSEEDQENTGVGV